MGVRVPSGVQHALEAQMDERLIPVQEDRSSSLRESTMQHLAMG